MESIIIFIVMTAAVFVPMIIFARVGYKAITELGKRPGLGGRVMIPLILKLTITAGIIIGMLMFLLQVFG